MNQRPPTFPSFAQNYAYAHHSYATQQQAQQPQFATNVQYQLPPQQGHNSYYPSLPPTPTVTQANQSLQQLRPQPAAPRRTNTTSSKSAGNANGSTAQDSTRDSPDASQFDGDVSLNFQDDNEGDDEPDSGPVFQLAPPPEATYASDKELEKAMHDWTLEHGYELVRRASKKNSKGVLYKRYYHCSKHGKIANTGKLTNETRVRVNRKSNRIGCPMSLAVVAVDPSNPAGQWQIRHRKSHHNHGPMEAVALAGHRRRARMGGVEKAVDGLFAIGTPTAQVLTFLQRTNPTGLFTRTDVANMKLKFKRYGTCVDRRELDQEMEPPRASSVCSSCRDKKIQCDSHKPQCTPCVQSMRDCQYPQDSDSMDMPPPPRPEPQMPSASNAPNMQQAQMSSTSPRRPPPLTRPQEDILADLEAFKANHVKPMKLNLQSSSVEVLAAASCGNGDSYRPIPPLENAEQWNNFHNAVADASMKENTFEVLVGTKVEPTRPIDESNIEEWNEYIKQLAIFNRRNTALLGALLPKLSIHYRPRVQHIKKASEVWQVLEELCQPRGSDRAYRLYLDLHSVTLQTCSGLRDYISKLDAAYNAMNRISHGTEERTDSRCSSTGGFRSANSTASQRSDKTKAVFSEDMLCFLFIKNLGPAFSRWSDGICRTSNVAGFGTGRRLGFADLTRSALEWEGMQSTGAGL